MIHIIKGPDPIRVRWIGSWCFPVSGSTETLQIQHKFKKLISLSILFLSRSLFVLPFSVNSTLLSNNSNPNPSNGYFQTPSSFFLPFPISFALCVLLLLCPKMKHFMLPRNPLRDAELASSATPAPSPSSAKTRPSRKHKHSKENDPPSDPNLAVPSPGKFKTPLPPRPPSSNPLKRKLAVAADALADNSLPASSDSGVKVGFASYCFRLLSF